MHHVTASALIMSLLAVHVSATPLASARAQDQRHMGKGSAMRAAFGDWIAFTTSRPTSRRCIVNNGPFWFQLFADGRRDFGVHFSPNEAEFAANTARDNQPGILSARRIVGHFDTYHIRTRGLPKTDATKPSDQNNVVIDDPRLVIEVKSSRDGHWKDPVYLIDFLKDEREVKVIYDPKFHHSERMVNTARLGEVIDWCNRNLSE